MKTNKRQKRTQRGGDRSPDADGHKRWIVTTAGEVSHFRASGHITGEMSTSLDDHELLRRYADDGSEAAFAELVNRHVHHVYSAAWREIREPHTASDLTQAAFILLARKAGQVRGGESLSGWLFQTVRYAARNARRAAWRREHYEKEAAAMIPNSPEPEADSLWEQLAPLLNDALASLTASDRDVVTLRFFEKKSHEEIGTRLGVNEAVSRKRLSRAVERLRLFFARRGVAVAGTSLVVVLGTHSVSAAPAGLAGTVTASAVAKGAVLSASVAALVQGASQVVAWTKAKIAAAVVALAALASGGIVLSDSSRFRVDEVHFTSRFQSKSPPFTWSTDQGVTNLFVLTSQRRRWGIGGDIVERLRRLFPQALVHRLEVADDRGDSFAGDFQPGTLFDAKGGKFQLWQVPSFPRRGTNLFLRFFELGDDGRESFAAKFKIPNPARGSYPQLTAQTLPATTSDGNLAVTLERVEVGHPRAGLDAPVPSRRNDVPLTCLTVGLRQEGLSRLPWALDSIQVADATGNQWRTRPLATRALPGQKTRLQAAFGGALWPSESAWRFDLGLLRTDDFAPTDVLTVTNLPVPATNQVMDLKQDYQLAGQPLRLLSLLGSQAYPPEKGWVRVRLDAQGNSIEERVGLPPGGYLKLLVESKGAEVGQRVTLMAVTDERGRPVTIELGGSSQSAILNYLLAAEPDARSLTLRFVRQESRRVSFTARPTQVGSNAGR
ncbi:MAG: sigma-70 family RNA polymerase sigma factor [Verrucomicrobia bacterium]|nr:sigma-70 family RNA polymerase sigma factor [Verrucomicrobiota bacterium]